MAENVIGDGEALMLVAKLRAYIAEGWIEDGCRPPAKREMHCVSCRMAAIDDELALLGHEIASVIEFDDGASGRKA